MDGCPNRGFVVSTVHLQRLHRIRVENGLAYCPFQRTTLRQEFSLEQRRVRKRGLLPVAAFRLGERLPILLDGALTLLVLLLFGDGTLVLQLLASLPGSGGVLLESPLFANVMDSRGAA